MLPSGTINLIFKCFIQKYEFNFGSNLQLVNLQGSEATNNSGSCVLDAPPLERTAEKFSMCIIMEVQP